MGYRPVIVELGVVEGEVGVDHLVGVSEEVVLLRVGVEPPLGV